MISLIYKNIDCSFELPVSTLLDVRKQYYAIKMPFLNCLLAFGSQLFLFCFILSKIEQVVCPVLHTFLLR